MRDRRVRVVFLGLILSFPLLMAAASPRVSLDSQFCLTILGVEAVLAGGLANVARERRRLLSERATAADRGWVSSNAPHVRAARRAPASARISTRRA